MIIYGTAIWNPLDLLSQFLLDDATGAERFGVFVIAAAFVLAQLGTNIAANSVSAGMSLEKVVTRTQSARVPCEAHTSELNADHLGADALSVELRKLSPPGLVPGLELSIWPLVAPTTSIAMAARTQTIKFWVKFGYTTVVYNDMSR